MFNLDHAIAEWRRQMIAGGIRSPEILDELESHLREDIEQQTRAGLNAQQAFENAVQRMGKSGLLKAEFAKLGGLKEARPGKVIGIACCAFAGLFSLLWMPALLTIRELSMTERMCGLGAVALTALSIGSWRFSYKFLPVIRNRPVRMAIGVTCGVAGTVWMMVFTNVLLRVIVSRVLTDSGSDALGPIFKIAISALWALALTAVLGGIAYGLEEAASRDMLVANS